MFYTAQILILQLLPAVQTHPDATAGKTADFNGIFMFSIFHYIGKDVGDHRSAVERCKYQRRTRKKERWVAPEEDVLRFAVTYTTGE